MIFTAARRARPQTTTMPARRPLPSRRKTRGQSLVEFALIFPLFIILLLSIIEFMFLFNAQLSLNYATRDASLIAAEAGNNANADCQILQQVDRDLNPPTDVTQVITVHIFSATETGAQLSTPKEQTYTRDGTHDVRVDHGAVHRIRRHRRPTRPTSAAATLTGRAAPRRTRDRATPVSTSSGSAIDYGYHFVTPLGSAIALVGGGQPLWGGAGMSMSTGNAMRMEPIL